MSDKEPPLVPVNPKTLDSGTPVWAPCPYGIGRIWKEYAQSARFCKGEVWYATERDALRAALIQAEELVASLEKKVREVSDDRAT